MNCKKRMFCRVAAEPDSVLYTEYGYSGRSRYHNIFRFEYKYPPAFRSKDYAPAGEKIRPPPLGMRPRQSGRKNCALSESAFRFAIWGGRILFACGAIVFPAKFSGVAPRRAAPRSMRGDKAMPCHDMSIRCHAMHRNSRPGDGSMFILKYGIISTEYYTERNMWRRAHLG